MDNAQARFFLHSYRPGGRDAADPVFADALEQARRDPVLAQWLEEQQAFDALTSAKFNSVEPPCGLKASLLAASKVTPFPVSRFHMAGWMKLAAAIIILATVLGVFYLPMVRPSFAEYEGDLVQQIVTGQVEALNVQDSRVDILKGWLAEHHAPADIDVPAGLRRLPSLGCRTFTWKGRNIAQICFTFEDGKIAHLFVIKEEAWHGAPPEGHPQFSSHGEWTMASWREAGATYIMARVGNQSDLEKLFL